MFLLNFISLLQCCSLSLSFFFAYATHNPKFCLSCWHKSCISFAINLHCLSKQLIYVHSRKGDKLGNIWSSEIKGFIVFEDIRSTWDDSISHNLKFVQHSKLHYNPLQQRYKLLVICTYYVLLLLPLLLLLLMLLIT